MFVDDEDEDQCRVSFMSIDAEWLVEVKASSKEVDTNTTVSDSVSKVIWALALGGTAGRGIGQHGIDELKKGHRRKGRR